MHHVWKSDLDWDTPLWRYFKTQRFVELLQSSTIYFPSARQFEDRFEGAVAIQSPDFEADPRYAEMEYMEHSFEELTRLTKISCWHRADFECDSMWKLYAGLGKSVAIRTSLKKLSESLDPFHIDAEHGAEDLWGGAVQYKDLTRVRLNPGMLERFFYKHRAFEWEHEFRLAISVRLAEEYGVQVPNDGVQVGIQCAAMVERVILGPSLSPEDHEIISDAANTAGIADRLETSTLLFRPRYI